MAAHHELYSELIDTPGFVRRGDFVLASGKYCTNTMLNLKAIGPDTDVFYKVATELTNAARKIRTTVEFDGVTAVPDDATPLGRAVSGNLRLPFVELQKDVERTDNPYVLKEETDRCYGDLRLLLVEGVATTYWTFNSTASAEDLPGEAVAGLSVWDRSYPEMREPVTFPLYSLIHYPLNAVRTDEV